VCGPNKSLLDGIKIPTQLGTFKVVHVPDRLIMDERMNGCIIHCSPAQRPRRTSAFASARSDKTCIMNQEGVRQRCGPLPTYSGHSSLLQHENHTRTKQLYAANQRRTRLCELRVYVIQLPIEWYK